MSETRAEREEHAREHISNMWEQYRPEINQSINATHWFYDAEYLTVRHEVSVTKTAVEGYEDYDFSDTQRYDTEIKVVNLDSISAVFKCCENHKFIVHDFASYTNPGGGFLNGSIAQEEAVCHHSTLMNCLGSYIDVYGIQRENKCNSLYRNSLLYVPHVIFTKDSEIMRGDVVVCAAPNAKAAQRNGIGVNACKEAMYDRIDFMLYCLAQAYNKDVDNLDAAPTLVLGAFGTGVFGNDTEYVAKVFKKLLNDKYKNVFREVLFAIPTMRPDDTTYNIFKKVIGA